MEINALRSAVTVCSLLTFVGIIWWAFFNKNNAKRFEEAANLPFSDIEAERIELGLPPSDEERKTS